MLAVARQPRLIKPTGFPRVDLAQLPRGMTAGPVLDFNGMGDPVSGRAMRGFRNPSSPWGNSPFGRGVLCNYMNVEYWIPGSGQAGTTYTREILFWTGATVSAHTMMTDYDLASSNDKAFSVTAGSKLNFYLWDGGTKNAVSTTTLVANRLYHGVATHEGGSLKLYLNGVLEATTAVGTPSVYTAWLRIGGEGANTSVVLYASAAPRVAWTPEEVGSRCRNPFGHLIWPEDDILGAFVRGATSILRRPLVTWMG